MKDYAYFFMNKRRLFNGKEKEEKKVIDMQKGNTRFIFVLLIFLFLSSVASAYVEVISNTDDCLIYCEAILHIVPDSDKIIASASDWHFDFIKADKKMPGLKEYWYEIAEDVPFTVDVPQYKRVVGEEYDANTDSLKPYERYELTGYKKETRYKRVWHKAQEKDMLGMAMNGGKDYYVKIVGIKNLEWVEGKGYQNNIDWVPTIFGVKYEQWAWWDSDYAYKRRIDLGAGIVAQQVIRLDINAATIGAPGNFYSSLNSNDGNAIAFTNCAEDTQLWHNKVFYNDDVNARYDVNVGIEDTCIYMYYSDDINSLDHSRPLETYVAFDDFSDGDYTGGYMVWTPNAGTWAVENGRLGFVSGTAFDNIYSENDYNFLVGSGCWWEVDAFNFDDAAMGISSRGHNDATDANGYEAMSSYVLPSDTTIQTRYAGKTVNPFAKTNLPSIDANSTMRAARTAAGVWNLYLDDLNVAQGNDTNFNSLRYFTWMYGLDTGAQIDNFKFVDKPFFTGTITIQSEEIGAITTDFNYSTPGSLDLENGITSVTVDLNDTSLIGAGHTPSAYVWTIDDVNFSSDQNTSRAFTTAGDYNTCLTVWIDANALHDQACHTITISQVPQALDYTYTINAYTSSDVNVQFNGTYTGTATNHWWFYQDTNYFGTTQNKSVKFFTSNYGDLNVCLTVANGDTNKSKCKVFGLTLITVKIPKDEGTAASITPFGVSFSTTPLQDNNSLEADNNFLVFSTSTTDYTMYVDANVEWFGRYYVISSDGTWQTLQPYLVSSVTGTSMTLITQNPLTLSRIPDVTVLIYKYFAGDTSRTLVENVTTDIKGEALISGVTNEGYEYDVYYGGVLIDSVDVKVTSTTVVISFIPATVTPITIGGVISCSFNPMGGKLSPGQSNIKLTVKYENVNIDYLDVNALLKDDYNSLYSLNIYSSQFTSINNGWSHTFTIAGDFALWADANYSLLLDVNIVMSDENSFRCVAKYYRSDMNRMGDILLDLLRNAIKIDLGCSSDSNVACGTTIIISLFLTAFVCGGIVVSTPLRDPIWIIGIGLIIFGFWTYIGWMPFFLYVGILFLGGIGELIMVWRLRSY
jgi:hypothetical protein